MKTIASIILITLFLQGCASSFSYVHPIGKDSYMVEVYYDPQNITSQLAAMVLLDKRSENACAGNYNKTNEYTMPDHYWGEFIIYREIICSSMYKGML